MGLRLNSYGEFYYGTLCHTVNYLPLTRRFVHE